MYQLKEGQEEKENFKNICSKWGINEAFWTNVEDLKFTSPKPEYVFNAFKIGENNSIITPDKVKVLIIGQDPYPDNDEFRVEHYGHRAHGFAFSFQNEKGINEPADDSLLNIFKAIVKYKKTKLLDDIYNWNTNLKAWAQKNNVLLLNAALTHNSPNENIIKTHRDAWESFIKEVIKKLLVSDNKTAIFLWGKKAQETFFKAFNESDTKKDDIIIDITKPKNKGIEYKQSKSLKIKTSIELIRGTIELGNKLIYLTSHPSDLGVNDGFADDAPNHFEACDKFLFENDESKYIWKNFPKNM